MAIIDYGIRLRSRLLDEHTAGRRLSLLGDAVDSGVQLIQPIPEMNSQGKYVGCEPGSPLFTLVEVAIRLYLFRSLHERCHREMTLVERSRDWLRQAVRDLENAENATKGGFHEWACFSSQQAAEKAVKALFQARGAEVLGYSVYSMVRKMPSDLTIPERFYDMARELDKAYVPTRYPNAHPDGAPFEFYTPQDAERLISYAREIIEFCKGNLSRSQS